jgi:probable F420-dependent oxidoreductase
MGCPPLSSIIGPYPPPTGPIASPALSDTTPTPTVALGPVGIWTAVLDACPSAVAQQHARRLEELGFSTVWIPEALGRDPFVTATLLLSATERLQVATGIANIYARDALTMANTQRSLEEAFPGRFLLGLGVSHHHLVEGVRHHDYFRPYSRMVNYLEEMDNALFMAVGPSQRPSTVLAALGPKMLRLAAERAAGAHPYFVPVEHTARAREILGPDPILAPEQMVVLETDPARAREIARAGMAIYLRAPNYLNNLQRLGFTEADVGDGGSDRLVDAIVAWGEVDAVVDRVQAHRDAGASHVCLQVLTGDYTTVPEGAWAELAAALV